MDTYLELYHKKLDILTNTINKIKTEIEDTDLIYTSIDDYKVHSKTFLIQTLSHIKYISSKSTKIFTNSKYYVYTAIKDIWGACEDEDKTEIWKTLCELLVLSVYEFPILKKTDYTYVTILLSLTKCESDIPIPRLYVLDLFSACLKETMTHLKKELADKKISENLIERITMEFQQENITSVQQLGKLKKKMFSVMERPEVKYITDIIKSYFTEQILAIINDDCTRVFGSDKFKACTQKYKKNKIMMMVQTGQISFAFIRQMIDDSGISDLLGDGFEFPTSFPECMVLIQKYTGKKFEEKDLKGFFTENVSHLLEIPQVKSALKNSGFKDILEPFMGMFQKRDLGAEKSKRKEKRQKQKLKKILNE
jgi:predicted small metal-binding protein